METRLVVLCIWVGVALRFAQFVSMPPLWVDEAWIALNVGTRSFLGLVKPLDYYQIAPIPFLWAERLSVGIAGMSEFSLRAFPFVCGLLLLLAIRRLANRILPQNGVVWATLLAALSPSLVAFSREAKPYSADALVASVVLLAASEVLDLPASSEAWRRLWAAVLLASVASIASPLFVGGMGAALLASRRVRTTAGASGRLVRLGAAFGLLYMVVFVAVYRRVGGSEYMREFWRYSFLRLDSWQGIQNSLSALQDVVWRFFMGAGVPLLDPRSETILEAFGVILFAVLVCVGFHSIIRKGDRDQALLLVSPILATLVGAAVRQYPISLRLVQFWGATLVILAGAGIADVFSARFLSRRGLRWLLAMALLAPAAVAAMIGVIRPPRAIGGVEAGGPAVRQLWTDIAAGEPVYIYPRAIAVWTYYSTDWSRPDFARLAWYAKVGGPDGPSFENRAPRRDVVPAGESVTLHREYRGHTELPGLGTGIQYFAVRGLSKPRPDRGWAHQEALRIRSHAAPSIWLFMDSIGDGSYIDLLDELALVGGGLVTCKMGSGTLLLRYEFDGSASSPTSGMLVSPRGDSWRETRCERL